MNILLTGGLGYIGSHTAVTLLEAGHQLVIFDNLSNSNTNVLNRLESITGKSCPFVKGDVRDTELVNQTLKKHSIDSVVHFAGLKAVGESVEKPLAYYSNNVEGTISLLEAMEEAQVYELVFSSSATVYGEPQYLPLDEQHPTSAVNPYGRTKLHIEEMLKEVAQSNPNWKIVCLRYFNPVGAHPSGLIGEDPNGIPNNLMPFITRVAFGILPELSIFGGDYSTDDGTAIRDYIQVCDLAEGHRAALDHLKPGWDAVNLGTGKGFSVLQMVKAFEESTGQKLPHKITERRPGDVAVCYAKTDKATAVLNWQASRGIKDMCESSWNFQKLRNQNERIA